jgi:hypothetical protein
VHPLVIGKASKVRMCLDVDRYPPSFCLAWRFGKSDMPVPTTSQAAAFDFGEIEWKSYLSFYWFCSYSVEGVGGILAGAGTSARW